MALSLLLFVILFANTASAYTDDGSAFFCDSCGDCKDALNNNTHNTVYLNSSITVAGTCIDNPENFTDKILDCKGYTIESQNIYTGDGIYVEMSENVTIRNCTITKFESAIFLNLSSNDSIVDNNLSNNRLGLGGITNYTIIQNNVANNNTGLTMEQPPGSTGILVLGSHNIIRNNTLQDNMIGIQVTSGDPSNPIETKNNTIINNNASYNNFGIFLNAAYSTVANNTANNNTGANESQGPGSAGITVMGSHNTIRNNTLQNNLYGITVAPGDPGNPVETINNTIADNDASYNKYGIRLENSSDNTLSNNTANSNTKSHGIWLDFSSNNTVSNNTANLNSEGGICLDYSNNNTVTDNTANENKHCGIQLLRGGYKNGSCNNTVTNNTANNNDNGICLQDSSNYNTIEDNTANNNTNNGVHLDKSNNNMITDNNASYNEFGIYLESSSNNNVLTNNTASYNGHGIYVKGSSYLTIQNNTVNNNTGANESQGPPSSGILLEESNHSIIRDNQVSNNSLGIIAISSVNNTLINNAVSGSMMYGIGLISCSNHNLTQNEMVNNQLGLVVVGGEGGPPLPIKSHYNHTIDTSNEVNGKPVYHYFDEQDQVVEDKDSGHLGLMYCSNFTLRNNTANNGDGIWLFFSNDTKILNNTASYNPYGMFIHNSSYTTVENNTANKNTGMPSGQGSPSTGILLSLSDHSSVRYNKVLNNTVGIGIGSGSFNILTDNMVGGNDEQGIWIGSYGLNARENEVINNTIWDNDKEGIQIQGSDGKGNVTYDNNKIINNTVHGHSTGIRLEQSSNNTLSGNTVYNSTRGIEISTDFNTIINNTVFNTTQSGFLINTGSDNNLIANNTAYGNGGNGGLEISGYNGVTANNTIVQNDFSNNYGNGITAHNLNETGSVGNVIADNKAGFNAQPSIFLNNVNNVTVANNTLYNNSGGIELYGSDFNTIMNNTAYNNTQSGFFINMGSDNNLIANNTAYENSGAGGLEIFGYTGVTANNTIMQNDFSNNYGNGITAHNLNETGSVGNLITDNDVNFNANHGISLENVKNVTVTGNIANNNTKSGIELKSSGNNTLSGNMLHNNSRGITPTDSDFNTIANNNITSKEYGIQLDSCSNNNLNSNNINTSGQAGNGIHLESSSDNTLNNNNITTSGEAGFGIFLKSSSNNTLNNNDITTTGQNGDGIHTRTSTNNTVTDSNIQTNSSNAFALHLYENSNITVINSVLNASCSGIADVHFMQNGTINLTNTTFNKSETKWESNATDAVLNVFWYLDIRAMSPYGQGIDNVNVTLYDYFNNSLFNNLTNSSGYLSMQTVTEYRQNGSAVVNGTPGQNITYYTPHNITAKWKSQTDSGLYTINESRNIIIYISTCGDGICNYGETTSSCSADCPAGNGGDGRSRDGGLGPGPTPQNRTQMPTLVPGVGLRNNTKLQAAIEKVLAKGNMSDTARENLLRLSASITSDISATRMFNVSGTKSRVTTMMRYAGQKKVKNFILFESVPKTFTRNASFVTLTAPGGTVEVAEHDPSWVILYPEIRQNQEITVTYEVSGIKSSSVIDDMTTEVYAESLEEVAPPPTQICTAGTKRCSDSNLQQCSSDGTKWDTIEACTYGCDSSTLACKEKPAAPPTVPGLEEIPWTLIAGVVIVAALVVVAAVVYLKKFRKAGGAHTPTLESVKQNF